MEDINKGGKEDAQAQKDRSGFSTTVANTTGGEFKGLQEGGSQEVGEENEPPQANKG